jgi:3-oxoadipate enol-lactonase
MAGTAPVPTELVARDDGEGPVIVLVHGVGGSHTVWNEVIPDLVGSFRVLAPDLRGHGRTPAPAGSECTFDEHAADLLHLLGSKGVDRCHLVGLSSGAMLALRLTLDLPERVRSLTMMSGAAYCDAHTRSIAERWIEVYAKEGPDALALRLLKDLYYPDWMEEHLDFADQVRAEVPHQDFGPASRWSRAMMKFDERGRIASVSRPTLIVQAMDDQVVDASHGRILRQSIPGAQIRIFAETGHMIPTERPHETAEAIGRFVRETEAAAPPAGRS